MKNKIIAAIFALTLSLVPVKAFAEPVNYHAYETTFISTEKEFKAIAQNPNGKYILLNDIVLKDGEFSCLGEFNGELDGNGHRISNYYSSKGQPMFSVLGKSASIRNLTIDGNLIATGNVTKYQDSAFIAYLSYGYIYNCNTMGRISQISGTYIESLSGLVGNNFGCIENCTNEANITSKIWGKNSRFVGGATGGICSNNYGTILGCTNKGIIDSETQDTGGIAGISKGFHSCISDCTNLADVTAEADMAGYNCTVGGIVGVAGNSYEKIEYCLINNCVNKGRITTASDVGAANYANGGICGSAEGYTTLVKCTNRGNVKSNNKELGTGGICGMMALWAYPLKGDYKKHPQYFDGLIEAYDCVNYGTLAGYDCGGCVGYAVARNGTINISRCSNKGKIKAQGHSASIIACKDSSKQDINIIKKKLRDPAKLNSMSTTVYIGETPVLYPTRSAVVRLFVANYGLSEELTQDTIGGKKEPYTNNTFTASTIGKTKVIALFDEGQVLTVNLTIKEGASGLHDYDTSIVPATSSQNGSITEKCTVCKENLKTTTIYKIKNISVDSPICTYTGKKIEPTITVTDSKGKEIPKRYYTITYQNNIQVGKAAMTVNFRGLYKGTVKKTFKIVPKNTQIKSIKSGRNELSVNWSKLNTRIDGYEIQYSLDKEFKKSETITIKDKSIIKTVIPDLGKNKRYYVRIRTYKNVSGKKYFSLWSKVLKGKTK